MYNTNGFLVTLLSRAADNTEHPNHNEARAYLTKFRDLEQTFFEKVHPLVDMGLAMSEVRISGGDTPHIFTIHGSRHVSDLIQSLDHLAEEISLQGTRHEINVLEAYILLCAAHVHDSGNIKGRVDHAQACAETIKTHFTLFASSAVVQQVFDVAAVHGGTHTEFGHDTIRSIDADNLNRPRLPLLAALLRLGDELSENAERVPEEITANHEASERSKLAHAYASTFTRFSFRKETLFLVYSVYQTQANLICKIDENEVPFYDFLEGRLDKIELEARYCSQYGRPVFTVSEIDTVIYSYSGECPSPLNESLRFKLRLSQGYPAQDKNLCERAEELKDKGVTKLRECFIENG